MDVILLCFLKQHQSLKTNNNKNSKKNQFWNWALSAACKKVMRKADLAVERVIPASLKSRGISGGFFLMWYLWTRKGTNPFIYLILNTCPNTISFLIQRGWKKVSAWKILSLTTHFLPWPDPAVKSKWQIGDIIIIFLPPGTNCEAINTGWWLHCGIKQSSWLQRKEGTFLFKHT